MKNGNILNDGEFDILAQCSVKSSKRIFSFLDDKKFVNEINNNKNITCIVCRKNDIELLSNPNMGIIISDNPRLTFFKIHNNMEQFIVKNDSFIDSSSIIAKTAIIDEYNVNVGKNVVIEDYAIIKENVDIGDNTIIRSGSVIGGQGFEFKRDKDNTIHTIKHYGKVKIGSFVEIKEYVTIHTALFQWDETRIEDYTKIDSKSHIGHGTKIGSEVMIGSNSNLAGNISIGNNIFIGPSVTISNRVRIDNNSRLNIGSVVNKDVSSNQIVTGNFAIPHNLFLADLKSKFFSKED